MRQSTILALAAILGTTTLWAPFAAGQQKAKPGDLKKMADTLLRSAKEGRGEPFQQLAIPNPEEWFASVFGPESGAFLARVYASESPNFAVALQRRFAEVALKAGRNIHVDNVKSISGWDRPRYLPFLPVVATARTPEELFGLWVMIKDQPLQSLGYWSFVEGQFRFVGWLYAELHPNESTTKLLWVGPAADFQDFKIVEKGKPTYPAMARRTRTQGVVQISGSVGADGLLRNIRAEHGHPLLIEATIESARRYKFGPVRINGQAIEIMIVMEMVYTISE